MRKSNITIFLVIAISIVEILIIKTNRDRTNEKINDISHSTNSNELKADIEKTKAILEETNAKIKKIDEKEKQLKMEKEILRAIANHEYQNASSSSSQSDAARNLK